MKISIALSLLILAIAASLGWQDRQRLGSLRAKHEQLVADASKLGISIDPSRPSDSVRVTKRGRENRDVSAKSTAAELISFAKEMEAMEKSGNRQPGPEMQQRILDLMDKMMALDSSQIKILIAEIRNSTDLKDETRQNIIGFSIMTLANDHPQAALALFTESGDLMKENRMSEHVISSALARWAKDDPTGALAWVRENAKTHPDIVTDDAKRGLINGAASEDPKLAFQLIGELGLKEPQNAINGILNAARTPAERTATLAALREHLGTIADEKARADALVNSMQRLGSGIVKDRFEVGSRWIDEAKLSPSELVSLTRSLRYNVKSEEAGQWIDWMGKTLPAEKSAEAIRDTVRTWTQNDYQAAGKWLATAPEGPAKIASVRAYAETVSRYEPETAAQWALTLPAGKDRDSTLRNIYQSWPKNDATSKAAAEAFKAEHGIK